MNSSLELSQLPLLQLQDSLTDRKESVSLSTLLELVSNFAETDGFKHLSVIILSAEADFSKIGAQVLKNPIEIASLLENGMLEAQSDVLLFIEDLHQFDQTTAWTICITGNILFVQPIFDEI